MLRPCETCSRFWSTTMIGMKSEVNGQMHQADKAAGNRKCIFGQQWWSWAHKLPKGFLLGAGENDHAAQLSRSLPDDHWMQMGHLEQMTRETLQTFKHLEFHVMAGAETMENSYDELSYMTRRMFQLSTWYIEITYMIHCRTRSVQDEENKFSECVFRSLLKDMTWIFRNVENARTFSKKKWVNHSAFQTEVSFLHELTWKCCFAIAGHVASVSKQLTSVYRAHDGVDQSHSHTLYPSSYTTLYLTPNLFRHDPNFPMLL